MAGTHRRSRTRIEIVGRLFLWLVAAVGLTQSFGPELLKTLG